MSYTDNFDTQASGSFPSNWTEQRGSGLVVHTDDTFANSSVDTYSTASWDDPGTISGKVTYSGTIEMNRRSIAGAFVCWTPDPLKSDNGDGYFLECRGSYYSDPDELRLIRADSGSQTIIATDDSTFDFEGEWYHYILEGGDGTVRVKMWKDGDSEPGSWTLSVSDNNHTSGKVGVAMSHQNIAYQTSFDTVSVDGGPTSANQDPVGALTVTGYDPVVTANAGINQSPVGTLTVTGYDPVVTAESSQVDLHVKFKDASGNVWERLVGRRPTVANVSSSEYNASSLDEVIFMDATALDTFVHLPTAVGREGFFYWVTKTDSSSHTVTVTHAAIGTIIVLYFEDETVTLTSDGTTWRVV